MLKTLEATKRTETEKALGLNGNGLSTQSLKDLAPVSYRLQAARVNRLAELAIELAKIEIAIKENQAWMHAQPCPCEQCSAVFAELLKLSGQRRKVLAEIEKLS
jgi:hypothetical protein